MVCYVCICWAGYLLNILAAVAAQQYPHDAFSKYLGQPIQLQDVGTLAESKFKRLADSVDNQTQNVSSNSEDSKASGRSFDENRQNIIPAYTQQQNPQIPPMNLQNSNRNFQGSNFNNQQNVQNPPLNLQNSNRDFQGSNSNNQPNPQFPPFLQNSNRNFQGSNFNNQQNLQNPPLNLQNSNGDFQGSNFNNQPNPQFPPLNLPNSDRNFQGLNFNNQQRFNERQLEINRPRFNSNDRQFQTNSQQLNGFPQSSNVPQLEPSNSKPFQKWNSFNPSPLTPNSGGYQKPSNFIQPNQQSWKDQTYRGINEFGPAQHPTYSHPLTGLQYTMPKQPFEAPSKNRFDAQNFNSIGSPGVPEYRTPVVTPTQLHTYPLNPQYLTREQMKPMNQQINNTPPLITTTVSPQINFPSLTPPPALRIPSEPETTIDYDKNSSTTSTSSPLTEDTTVSSLMLIPQRRRPVSNRKGLIQNPGTTERSMNSQDNHGPDSNSATDSSSMMHIPKRKRPNSKQDEIDYQTDYNSFEIVDPIIQTTGKPPSTPSSSDSEESTTSNKMKLPSRPRPEPKEEEIDYTIYDFNDTTDLSVVTTLEPETPFTSPKPKRRRKTTKKTSEGESKSLTEELQNTDQIPKLNVSDIQLPSLHHFQDDLSVVTTLEPETSPISPKPKRRRKTTKKPSEWESTTLTEDLQKTYQIPKLNASEAQLPYLQLFQDVPEFAEWEHARPRMTTAKPSYLSSVTVNTPTISSSPKSIEFLTTEYPLITTESGPLDPWDTRELTAPLPSFKGQIIIPEEEFLQVTEKTTKQPVVAEAGFGPQTIYEEPTTPEPTEPTTKAISTYMLVSTCKLDPSKCANYVNYMPSRMETRKPATLSPHLGNNQRRLKELVEWRKQQSNTTRFEEADEAVEADKEAGEGLSYREDEFKNIINFKPKTNGNPLKQNTVYSEA